MSSSRDTVCFCVSLAIGSPVIIIFRGTGSRNLTTRQHVRRYREADLVGGFEIDHEVEFVAEFALYQLNAAFSTM